VVALLIPDPPATPDEPPVPVVPEIPKANYDVPFEMLKLSSEVKKAVILHHGKLTPDYEYINEYL